MTSPRLEPETRRVWSAWLSATRQELSAPAEDLLSTSES